MARTRGITRAVERGQRVFLRRPAAGDEGEYCRLGRASADFLRPWEPRPPKVGGTPEDAFRKLLRINRSKRSEKLLICACDDGRILGQISINEIIGGVLSSAFLGYWIGAPHARQGYMTEALQLALCRAFGTLGLHRVEANIIPRNQPSIRLVTRAGFRKEGLSLRYVKIAGKWQDHERWALLVDEFRRRRAR